MASTTHAVGAGRVAGVSGDRLRVAVLLGAAALAFSLGQRNIGDVRLLFLPDNDDAMRLAAVRDLLAGQGWFDPLQHRFLPPGGASMHWSRWIDAPIAALVLALQAILGPVRGEVAAVLLWPPLVFVAFAAVLWREVRRLFGVRAAGFAVLAATQISTVGLWGVGRIDHHNVQATLLVFATCLVGAPRSADGSAWRRPALAGVLCGLSLSVGLETLPFVAVLGAVASLAWVAKGPEAGVPLASFGIALALASLGFFAGTAAPGAWTVAECDALSPPWLVLGVGGGVGAAFLAGAGRVLSTVPLRLAVAAVLGGVLAAAFATLAPACLAGPYAGLPEFVRTEWLDRVVEAQSAFSLWRSQPGFCAAILLAPVIAVAICLAAARQAEAEAAGFFLAGAAFLVTGLAVSAIQVRGVYIGAAILPAVAGFGIDRSLAAIERGRHRRGPLVLLVLSILTLAPAWIVAEVAVEAVRGPAGIPIEALRQRSVCARPSALAVLDAVPPGLILASTELGPSLLVGTRHSVVSAPYHRNVEGIEAGIAAEAGDEAAVAAAARRFRPDYLLVCADWPVPPEALASRLAAGNGPAWLRPVPLPPGGGGLRLFSVSDPPGRDPAGLPLRPALP